MSDSDSENCVEIQQPSINFTPDQTLAKQKILEFIRGDKTHMVLYGAAGTGKSRLTRAILDEIRTVYSVAGVAPTHKARRILDRFLNINAFITVKTLTVASLLNKLRTHSYIGTKKYDRGADTKINSFDIFFIDEVSMITDEDYFSIIQFAEMFKKKIIFIGDRYQIPNPSQRYIKNNDGSKSYSKKDSIAFQHPNSIELTTIVRQNQNNPLVKLYMQIREAIINDKPAVYDRSLIESYTDISKWYSRIDEVFKKIDRSKHHLTRILAYTNEAVRNHNKIVRKTLGISSPVPVVGELLMGYNSIGWPEAIIENSQDYYVTDIKVTINYKIEKFSKLVGHILELKETESEATSTIFMPDICSEQNKDMLQELVARSEKVNKKYSTKDDFKKYMSIKNKMIFMENIYKYKGEIMSEYQFRVSNPLLFKSITDVILENDGEREIVTNKLSTDIDERYPGLLEKRYEDDKPLSESEKLSDSFQILEKDIDYGYAITVHKSQASSFDTVFIDEADIEKIKDCWSYKLDALIRGRKEQNQLKYVAYTRARENAIVFYRDAV